MSTDKRNISGKDHAYLIRMQIAIILSLLVFIGLFTYMPDNEPDSPTFSDDVIGEEEIDTRFIAFQQEPAVQRSAPPVPRPEAVVPDDEIVDAEFDLESHDIHWLDDLALFEPVQSGANFIQHPDRLPSVRRIVEPVMPSEARDKGLIAEIYVRFLVSETGEVEQAEIDQVLVFDPQSNQLEPVDDPGYDLLDIVLRAARQWRFQAAIHQGEPVRTWTRHRFTFSP